MNYTALLMCLVTLTGCSTMHVTVNVPGALHTPPPLVAIQKTDRLEEEVPKRAPCTAQPAHEFPTTPAASIDRYSKLDPNKVTSWKEKEKLYLQRISFLLDHIEELRTHIVSMKDIFRYQMDDVRQGCFGE